MIKFIKIVLSFLFLVSCSNGLRAQEIVKKFYKDSFTNQEIIILKSKYENNKELIPSYENQMLIALSDFS